MKSGPASQVRATKTHVGDQHRPDVRRERGLSDGEVVQHAIPHPCPQHNPPLRSRAEPPHPEEIAQQPSVDEVPAFQGLDDSQPRPFELRVEAQRLPEMLQGLVVFPLVQERPSLVGMGDGVLRIARQRGADRSSRLGAAAELHQGHRTEIRAAAVIRIVLQPGLRRLQRPGPLPLIEPERRQQREIARVLRLQADRLHDGRDGFIDPVSLVEDLGHHVVREAQPRGDADRRRRGLRCPLEILQLDQAEPEKRVAMHIVRIRPERLLQLPGGVGVAALLMQDQGALIPGVHAPALYTTPAPA